MTNGRPRPPHRQPRRRRRARGACTTRASSTRSPAGATATSRSTRPATCRCTRRRIPQRAIDLKELVDRLQLRGISLPVLVRFTDILKHRLGEIHAAFQARDHAAPVPGRLQLRLPDQGEPAAAGRRGGAQLRQAVQVRPRSRAPSRSCSRSSRSPTTTTPIICNGFKDAEFIETAMLAPEDRPQHHPGRREVHRARADPRGRREDRRAAADRHARQAGVARQRPLAVVRRLPLEVRPDRHRDHARARGAEGARHAGLPQAAALPPRQPDHQHPHRQGRAQRGGARLHRAGQAGRRPAVPRRRRRPRRRLRRLADQLRVEHELHARGVRQRRRLPHPDACATRPACRTRRSSRRAAAPSSPITACWCSTCSASRASATRRCRPTREPGLGAAARRPGRDLQQRQRRATRSRRSTTRSRRSTWR